MLSPFLNSSKQSYSKLLDQQYYIMQSTQSLPHDQTHPQQSNLVATLIRNSLDTQTVLILFIEIAIIVIYLVCLFFVVVRRAKKLLEMHNRKYYLIVVFYIASKLILCVVLVIQIIVGITNNWADIDPIKVELLVKTALILADFSIIQLFLVALETYFSHCFSAVTETITRKRSKMLNISIKAMQLLVAFILIIPLVVFDVDELGYNILNAISIGLNVIIVIIFLITFFYLNFKMTGIMMENKLNQVIKRIYKVQLIILVSRAFIITFEVIIALYVIPNTFQEEISIISQDLKYQIVLALLFLGSVLLILLSEGLPIMYSLRGAVVEALNHKNNSTQFKQSIFTDNTSDLQQSLVEKAYEERQGVLPNHQEIKLRNFTNLVDIKPDKEQNIWICKKGSFEGKDYMIRISKHQISSYIFEDIENEIALWNQINLQSLSKISYFCEGEIIHLIQKYYTIQMDNRMMEVTGQTQSLRLGLQLAEAIREFHDRDIVHGCLSPGHIFFDHSQICLNGFGLHSLKKYLSLITGYSNKNIYSAPEHLKDRNNIILKPKKSADIYSFGIILYQIITKNIQYRLLPLKQIQVKFAQQNIRPKLPEHIKFEVKNLIRKCWNQIAQKRPAIDEIIENIRKLI